MKEVLEKWQSIKTEIVNHSKQDWFRKYWKSCKYCEVYYNYRTCPLDWTIIEEMPICSCSELFRSHAFTTIELAEIEDYEKALKHCEIVIEVLERD